MSARRPATSASSSLRTFTSSVSVQGFSPVRTGRAAAPERAAAVMSGSLSASIDDDDCAGVDLESVQSPENRSLSLRLQTHPRRSIIPATGRLRENGSAPSRAIGYRWGPAKVLMGTAAVDRGQERPGDGESPGQAQRTRSPRNCRRNGYGQAWPVPSRTGRRTCERAAVCARRVAAVKEGGTAGPPPVSLVPPAKPFARAARTPVRRPAGGPSTMSQPAEPHPAKPQPPEAAHTLCPDPGRPPRAKAEAATSRAAAGRQPAFFP